MTDKPNRRLEGHQIVSIMEAVCITIGVVATLAAVAWFADGVSYRHQTSKAAQIQTCMDHAESDLALLACRKTI